MSVLHLIIGLVWLALGAFYIFGRNRIQTRQIRRLGRAGQAPMVWVVLGSIFVLCGAVFLAEAFA